MMKRKHIICESNIISKNETMGYSMVDEADVIKNSVLVEELKRDSPKKSDGGKPFHKRISHFEGMNDEEIKFFTPTQQGELLSCNYRLSLHHALQDYLVDLRSKDKRPLDERSDFDIEEDQEEIEKEGLPHPDFFDINIKHEILYKEFGYISKRLEERKKAKVKHAMRVHKKQVKEQENRQKENNEREKSESFQGDVIEDNSGEKSEIEDEKIEEKEEEKQSQVDDKPLVDSGSAEKNQDDSGKAGEKQPAIKSNVVLSSEEMKQKIGNLFSLSKF